MSITWELCEEYGKEYLMYGYLPGNPIHKYAIKKHEYRGEYVYSLFKRVYRHHSMRYAYCTETICSFVDDLDYCKNQATLDAKRSYLL